MDSFDSAYAGKPPWDIDRPQPELVRLAEAREIQETVLDVGCGTGENALYLARRGLVAWGIDASPRAIARAKAKAQVRGLPATFLVRDALDLAGLGRTFDTVIDSGLFHVFSDDERTVFERGLTAVLRPGGKYLMLCFSEEEPAEWGGPRRVAKAEILATFRKGWAVNYIRPALFETNLHVEGGRAWLSSITMVLPYDP